MPELFVCMVLLFFYDPAAQQRVNYRLLFWGAGVISVHGQSRFGGQFRHNLK